MTGKIIMVLLSIVVLVWSWQTGVLESIRSGAEPELGRIGVVAGPEPKQGVAMAGSPEVIEREIDAHVGASPSEKLEALSGVNQLYESGDLLKVKDNSKVKVLEIGSVKVQSVPRQIVKIKILAGEYKNAEGWIERTNLIDTPIQAVFQAIRISGKSPSSSNSAK